MNIKELHKRINNQREKLGMPPINDEEFVSQISQLQLQGKIKIENGEVKPVKNKEANY